MIAAFARAGFVLGESRYIHSAKRAADFIRDHLERDGRLMRSWCGGTAKTEGFLSDHAFLAFGLLELFDATGEEEWFSRARRITETMIDRFRDEAEGGFFMTSPDHDPLWAREKPFHDGAEPSGNAVAALHLLRMEALTSEAKYGDLARGVLRGFGELLTTFPQAAPFLLCALDYHHDDPAEIVLVDPSGERGEFLAVLRKTFLPNRVRVSIRSSDAEGAPTASICARGVCEPTVTDLQKFQERISRVRSL
jgi:uncharacterized protein YyaL (SSP411 family)